MSYAVEVSASRLQFLAASCQKGISNMTNKDDFACSLLSFSLYATRFLFGKSCWPLVIWPQRAETFQLTALPPPPMTHIAGCERLNVKTTGHGSHLSAQAGVRFTACHPKAVPMASNLFSIGSSVVV